MSTSERIPKKRLRRKRIVVPLDQLPVERRIGMIMPVDDSKRLFPTPPVLAYQAACSHNKKEFSKYQNDVPKVHQRVIEIAAERNDLDCIIWIINIMPINRRDCARAYEIAHDNENMNIYEYLKEYFKFPDLPDLEYETDDEEGE